MTSACPTAASRLHHSLLSVKPQATCCPHHSWLATLPFCAGRKALSHCTPTAAAGAVSHPASSQDVCSQLTASLALRHVTCSACLCTPGPLCLTFSNPDALRNLCTFTVTLYFTAHVHTFGATQHPRTKYTTTRDTPHSLKALHYSKGIRQGHYNMCAA